jgi:hypothetical protein
MKSSKLSNQSGNQNRYIEEEQTAQWPKEKVQKHKNDLHNINIIYFNTANIKIHLLYEINII